MAELLKGAAVAAAITENLAGRAKALKEKGIVPTLEILRIGENPGDLSYEKGALSRCKKVGIEVKHVVLPANAERKAVLAEIEKANADGFVHGLLMFRPLTDKETEKAAAELLAPEKDADAMTDASMAAVFTGSGRGFAPCTAESCIEILKYYGIDLAGANAVVIGRSNVIGKPVSMLLQKENATVTMCHTKTKNLAGICRGADIIVAAAGRANMVTAEFLREGQVVIDVGINAGVDGKLCGDVDFEAAEPVVKAITPVPGGVGAVTTSVLASHVVRAAETAGCRW